MQPINHGSLYEGYIDDNVIPSHRRMGDTAFERRMVLQERAERKAASHRYIAGVQGTDGGIKPHDPM